jgi:uncharacterized protein involved in response to NO
MRLGAALFGVTSAVIFLQLITGALRLFGFIDTTTHIAAGEITFGFALITMSVALVSKPSFRPVKTLSIALVVLIVVQAFLGLAFLATSSTAIILVHFTNALLIYSIGIVGVFYAMQWNKMQLAEGEKQKRGRIIVAVALPSVITIILLMLTLFGSRS